MLHKHSASLGGLALALVACSSSNLEYPSCILAPDVALREAGLL